MKFPLLFATTLMWGVSVASLTRAAGPADDLFRLVPADAGLAVAVEDLRDRAREIAESPLVDGLRRLPAVRSWLGSGQIRGVRQVARQIEEALGVPPGAIRDELFGDSVVLALRAGPGAAPEQARGLLLAKARDRALLDRLIEALNRSQTDSGELSGVARKEHGAGSYFTRTYSQAGRPEDHYTVFEDGAFAWSNGEDLIREVLDRKASGGPCLADDPGFRDVRGKLPEKSLISLYLSPRFVEKALFSRPRKENSTEDRVAGLFARYVGAMTYVGVALEFRDGLAIHAHEAIDPKKLDGWLRNWLVRPSSGPRSVGALPASAIAAVALDVDFIAARDAIWTLIPEGERPWYHNLKLSLQGLLLGQDLDSDILARLGPGVLACLNEPAQGPGRVRFPIAGAIGVKPGPDVPTPGPGAAIENAIRTGVSIYALDRSEKVAIIRSEDRTIGEAKALVISLAGRPLFVFAHGSDRLVLGNSPEAVAGFGADASPSSLEAIRSTHFADARTFAVVDLARLSGAIKASRGPLAEKLAAQGKRSRDEIGKDLDQVIAAADLFRAAAFTTTTDRDATSIHRVFRLIAR